MRLYGEKFAKRYIDQRVNRRKETGDAILWSIDWENKVAIVRVQGSDKDVVAHFPRNWKQKPYWLKPRNAVRIIYREGRRGYVEISGEGRAIPQPVDGPLMPDISGAEDRVLSGCDLVPTSPESLNLTVTSGYYRIDGTVYHLDPMLMGGAEIVMDVEPVMVMDSGLPMDMDASQYTVTVDAAPGCGQARYDAFVIGADGTIDYLKGAASSSPAKPNIPAGHVLLGDYILVKPSVTAIYGQDIGAEWASPVTSQVIVSSNATFPWNGSNSTPDIQVNLTVKDQYGCNVSVPAGSFSVTVEILFGSGGVGTDGATWAGSCAFTMGATGHFHYQRNQAATEHSPFFKITVAQASGFALETTHFVYLLDAGGQTIF